MYPAPTVRTEVTIILMDVNDETPTFRSKLYACEVNENAPMNTPLTFLGHALPQVFDYDQVCLVYSIFLLLFLIVTTKVKRTNKSGLRAKSG